MRSLFLIALFLFVSSTMAQKTWQELDSLTNYYLEKQILDSAEYYGLEYLKVLEARENFEDSLYMEACINMVYRFFYEGKYHDCLKYTIKAKDAVEKSLGKEHEFYFNRCNDIAYFSTRIGDYETALDYYLRVKSYQERTLGSDDPKYAETLKNLGDLYLNMGQYDQSYKHFVSAKNIEEKSLGKDNAAYAYSCFNLGLFFQTIGDYDKALDFYLESKEIRAKVLGKTHPDYAASCANIGGCYGILGDYQNALKYGMENLNILESTNRKNHFAYAIGIAKIGRLYISMSNYEKALESYLLEKEILKNLLGADNVEYAFACGDVASAYMKQKDYKAAEKEYKEQLTVIGKVKGKSHSNYAYACTSLGILKYYQKQNAEALDYYNQAQEIRKEIFGEDSRNYAFNFLNLGMLYDQMKNYEKAIEFYQKSIKARKKNYSSNHPKLAYSFFRTHEFLVRKGDLDLSEKYLLENLSINKERIENSFSFLTEEEQVNYIKTADQSFRSLYAFSNIRKEKNPGITGVAFDNLLMHKGLLLKSSTGMRFAILNSGDTNLIKKYENWMMYRKLITKEESKLLKKQSKNLKSWKEKAVELERELVQASSYFANEKAKQNINWKSVQNQLKKKEVAIEFVRFNAGTFEKTDSILYAALIINKTCQYPEMVTLFNEEDLAKIYTEVSGSDLVKTKNIYGDKKKRNNALYKLIWEPLEKYVPKGSKVYYSPDGILHRVSFSAIGSENWYLSDVYSIQRMSSTALIGKETEINLSENTRATIIGGVNYNSSKVDYEVWSYLPGTKTEIEQISELLEKEKLSFKLFTDKEATEGNIKNALANTDIAHFSTHGYFYPDPDNLWKNIETTIDSALVFRGSSRGGTRGFGYYSFLKNKNPMMRSGLALANANLVWNEDDFSNQEDGVLTAKEVSNLNLQDMKLVVLSACETGLGDIHGAEGVYGLNRAFKIAGAKYIVMSLWQVPDQETQEFMDLFYKNLIGKKMHIRLAFETAQNKLKEKYDPYFWAAFILVE